MDDNNMAENKSGKTIPYTDSDTSADEINKCSHLSFFTGAPKFGDESGDEEISTAKAILSFQKSNLLTKMKMKMKSKSSRRFLMKKKKNTLKQAEQRLTTAR